ncbi:MAG TPA: S46 family peptidase [Lentimicrobium sp.]|nr:S46 family peptidase [Lentimicrobium sp.]
MRRLVLLFFISISTMVHADEGMWLPLLIERLNYVDMQKEGLKLTPEEIYSVNHSSLKDAIIQFGNGCTGEIVSSQGLVFTNHHCGYGSIQSHSTIDHDYLADGFWAMSMKEELPNEGLTARFLVRIEDVTKRVLNELNDNMTEEQRADKVSEISKSITDEATKGNGYQARVASFFEGNEYYLFVYEVFRDVRLVGAPPSSIGKFGADTDNWMWPRHTGDFSIFRVYTGPDGKPADYSENNIPLKPKHHLPVSLAGVEKGDFAFIMGYPGGTERYTTSWGVDQAINLNNPTIVNIRAKKLGIMRQDMDADRDVNIKYASKYASIANYWKYFIGQTKGLKRLNVYEEKQKLESEFTNWVNAAPDRKAKYGDVLPGFENAYKNLNDYLIQRIYYSEAIARGAEIMTMANNFIALEKELSLAQPNQDKLTRMKEGIKKYIERHFKNYNEPTDRKLLSAMLEMYYKNVPQNQQPALFRTMVESNKMDFDKLANKIFDKSVFTNKATAEAMAENPNLKKLRNDPAFKLMKAFSDQFYANQDKTEESENTLQKSNRLFIAGLREMQPEKKFYPDANSTMRLTYGKVLDYYPADAVHYDYYTTMNGIMEKEDSTNWEFVVPDKLKQLFENKDFGEYGENGQMPVCFISTNDITGGNSGSPIMNGKGELIGLAFDGNWEAMSGDIAFEPELQRTINVDVRYVLFIIDKYAGAKNLINELTLVRKERAKADMQPVSAPSLVPSMN